MNLLINKWNYPSINLLGAIDNDSGHFPKNFVFDPNHPNDRGHEEFFFSISPGMFKSMEDNKAFPKEIIHNEAIELGKKSKHKKITYVPNHVIHSYTFMFSFKTEFNSKISSIKSFKNNNEISINEKGNIIYTSGNKSFKSKERITKRKWNKIAVSHRYLFSETHIFLNGSLILKISEQNEPVLFKIEQNKRTITYKDIYLYRTALNKTDINAITGGQFLHAGLDLYSPLNDKKLIVNSKIKNYALNDNYAVINSKNDDHKLKAIRGKIIEFNELRKNELKVKYKEPISINKKLYDKYVGNYEIAPGDYFEILKKDDKLYFADRGQETEIFPEAENKFFIKYPAELTIEFISNEKNEVAEMIFNFNGRKMKAQKK
ncbi:MAG: DUF3471 domain-containing protein [bacterium]|nr:DUF3471 domain-containing protein [bacterium]